LVIEGVYRPQNGKPVFEYVEPPTPEELARLLERIAMRVMGVLTRCGDVTEESGVPVFETGQGDEALAPLQVPATACVHFKSVSLHAELRCAKTARKKLERPRRSG
jgi:hypothetical protein